MPESTLTMRPRALRDLRGTMVCLTMRQLGAEGRVVVSSASRLADLCMEHDRTRTEAKP